MKRRDFSAQVVGLGLGAATLNVAHAQNAPVEGTHYVRLQQAAPVAAPTGKIEVVEFFWYGCPHCNAFEPALEAWAKRLPADVVLRRAPVAFRPEPHGTHQRLYFALEQLGLVDSLHRKVFYAIHNERQRLDRPEDIAAFVTKNGADGAKVVEAMKSFSVQTKSRQAAQLADAYKIDGVPTLGIAGRYFTSGALAGSPERSLAVADHLIARARKGA